MRYSLEKVSTVQACDTLLALAQKEKQTLDRKRRNLGESVNSFRGRIDDISKESALVQLSLEAFTAAYHALPEGRSKADMKVKIKRLEVRQALLEKKAYTYNVVAVVAKEIKYNRLNSQVAAMDNYITALQQRRTALSKAALRVGQAATFLRRSVARQRPQSKKSRYQVDSKLQILPRNSSLKKAHTFFGRRIEPMELEQPRPVSMVMPGNHHFITRNLTFDNLPKLF